MSNYPMSVTFFGNVVRAQTEGSRICLNDLFIAGNALRLAEGKPAKQMNAFLSSKELAEYVDAAAEEWNLPSEHFIAREGRGRSTRTFVHASVALLAAETMNPRFHAHVHKVFIEGKLLEFRELGGTEFKTLNAAIDQYLPGRDGKDNKGVFINVAKAVRERIFGAGAGPDCWNTATVDQTHMRYEWENKLSTMLRLGVVRDYEHLKELIERL
ncbi:hypothetical protein D3C85_285640 [compost metagenome]